MAQGQPLRQQGMATQENTDEDLTARHPVLPVGSKARVTNIANGKEIEVTISTNRIAPSATRIVDLSPAAASALDIGFGGPVIINQILAVRTRPEPSTPLTQRGMATQELADDDGLFAAHPILPIGSIVKVTNRANDKEIIVIIIDRINPSDTRVIDLSPGVALALDIGKGGPVTIEVLSMP
jgi:rare lipoprotein A (peptidoglycan hydrolase)